MVLIKKTIPIIIQIKEYHEPEEIQIMLKENNLYQFI